MANLSDHAPKSFPTELDWLFIRGDINGDEFVAKLDLWSGEMDIYEKMFIAFEHFLCDADGSQFADSKTLEAVKKQSPLYLRQIMDAFVGAVAPGKD